MSLPTELALFAHRFGSLWRPWSSSDDFQETRPRNFLFREPIDMRFGFHRLTGLVRNGYGIPKLSAGTCSFFWKQPDASEDTIFFDGTGVCLLIKRLEQGRFMWIRDVISTRSVFRARTLSTRIDTCQITKLGTMRKRKSIA